MANFKQHFQYGITSSLIAATIGHTQFDLSLERSATAFIIGVIASIAPDFDHPTSTPGDFLFNCLAIILPIMVIDQYFNTDIFQLEHWILLMTIGYLSIKCLLRAAFDKITVHRGIFHSIPAIILCGQCIFLLFFHFPLKDRIVITVIAMIGYFTHLIADEIYAVDWRGKKIRLKKSLGSALDLGNFDEHATWFAYILMVILGIFIFQEVTNTPVLENFKTYIFYYLK